MDSVDFFDTHTVFITGLGPVTAEQLNKAIKCYFELCSAKLAKPLDFWGKWKTNVVGNGVAYVFFFKSEAYHVITGNNPDGSARTEEVANPAYLEWEKQDDEFFNSALDISSSSEKTAWEDNSYNLFQEEFKQLNWSDISEYNPPPKLVTIPITEPLIEFPTIELTETQKKLTTKTEVKAKISKCFTKGPEEGYSSSTLFAKDLPAWITEEMIYNLFSSYTDLADKQKGYPKISLIKKANRTNYNDHNDKNWRDVAASQVMRKVFVRFNPGKQDAMFALFMTKRVTIQGSGNKTAELRFSYARETHGNYRTNRSPNMYNSPPVFNA